MWLLFFFIMFQILNKNRKTENKYLIKKKCIFNLKSKEKKNNII